MTITQKTLGAIRLLVALALLLSIGGYGGGIVPSARLCVVVLVALIGAGRWVDAVQEKGSERARAELLGWVREHRFALSLSGIVALAAIIRFAALTQDLGHVGVGIDENRLNTSILHFLRTAEIDHRTVEHYPGVHYWLLVGTYVLAFVRGLMDGVADNLARMPREMFFAAGRMTSALQSVATVVLVGLLGRRLVNARTGLWAAGLFAIAPLSVSLGRQLRNDAAQVLFVVAAVYLALEVLKRDHRAIAPLIGGGCAGLAAGIKYTGVFALIPVMLAVVSSEDVSRRAKGFVLASAGFVVAALSSNHFVVTDVPRLLYQLSSQVQITGASHWAAQDNPAAFHVMILATRVVGWPLLAVAAVMLAYQLAAGRWKWWVFAAYPLIYIAFVSGRPSQLPRWVYPAAPFVTIAAAAGLVAILDAIGHRVRADERVPPALRRVTLPVIAALLIAPVAWSATFEMNRRLAEPTFRAAEAWLEDNTQAGDRLLAQNQWLDLPRPRFLVNRVPSLGNWLDAGRNALGTHDWIVVHEAELRHPTLDDLDEVVRIGVDATWGGNQGPDFAVFAAPEIAPAQVPLELQLGAESAVAVLGPDWPPANGSRPGLALPAAGATLFLPPLGAEQRTLEVSVAAVEEGAPVMLLFDVDSRALRASQIPAGRTGVETYSLQLALRDVGPGVVGLRIRPGEGSSGARVLSLRLH